MCVIYPGNQYGVLILNDTIYGELKMNVKFLKLSIIILFSLTLMVLCLSDTRGLAGPAGTPGEAGYWFLSWRSYQGVSIDPEDIESWHERGSYILQNVDDDDDVSADVSLVYKGYSPDFSCDNGTANVNAPEQIYAMADAMSGGEDGFDALVVTSIYLYDKWADGCFYDGKIFIISSPAHGDTLLAHEVGHWATCEDIDTPGEEDRIMFKDGCGNELRSFEAEAYENGAQPPEKK